MISASALTAIGPPSRVAKWLARDRVLEIVSTQGKLVPGLPAVRAIVADSSNAVTSALGGRSNPPGALVFDLEHWQFSPTSEQAAPFSAEQMVVGLVARHPGTTLVMSPALDLTKTLLPSAGVTNSAGYLSLDLAGGAARALADFAGLGIVDIQAQSLELDPAAYASFVSSAVNQARAQDPHLVVIAGLSTSPPVGRPTLSELLADIKATDRQVQGYWLNVPRPGAHCPSCGPFDPALAAELLSSLVRNG